MKNPTASVRTIQPRQQAAGSATESLQGCVRQHEKDAGRESLQGLQGLQGKVGQAQRPAGGVSQAKPAPE